MFDPVTLGIIGGAAVLGSAAGAIGSAVNTSKARDEEGRNYQNARDYLNSEYYRDPLSSVGYRALMKTFGENRRDMNEKMNNLAVAGGYTVENQLAAKQNLNRAESDFNARLLQSVEARRQNLDSQRLQLENQHSLALQRNYLQDAQNWQAWGSQFGNAAMDLGNTFLLGK